MKSLISFRYRGLCLCSLLFFAIWMNSSTQAALLIDDFSVAQSVSSNSSSAVAGDSILGGERIATQYYYSTVEINTVITNQALLSATTGRLSTRLTYDGIGPFNLNGLSNLDLTEDGQNAGFLLTVADIETTIDSEEGTSGYVIISVHVRQEGNQFSEIDFEVTQAGTVFLPFSEFQVSVPAEAFSPKAGSAFSSSKYTPVDFSNVGYISIKFHGYNTQHIAIESFSAVPEPTTLALLGLGGLLVRRKK